MQDMKQTNLESLQQDSLDQTNQLTTREWVRWERQKNSWLCPPRQMITSDKWNDFLYRDQMLAQSESGVVACIK